MGERVYKAAVDTAAVVMALVGLPYCGPLMLLLLMTWRQTNEIWESVYVKDLTQAGGYEPLMHESSYTGSLSTREIVPNFGRIT